MDTTFLTSATDIWEKHGVNAIFIAIIGLFIATVTHKDVRKALAELLTTWLRYFTPDLGLERKMAKRSQQDFELNKLLEDLQKHFNLKRAAYFVYHNGGHNFIGQSFRNLTKRAEVPREGVAHTLEKWKGLQLEPFAGLMLSFKKNPFQIFNIEDKSDHTNYFILGQMQLEGINHLVCHEVKINGRAIGFVALSLDNTSKDLKPCLNSLHASLEMAVNKIVNLNSL